MNTNITRNKPADAYRADARRDAARKAEIVKMQAAAKARREATR